LPELLEECLKKASDRIGVLRKSAQKELLRYFETGGSLYLAEIHDFYRALVNDTPVSATSRSGSQESAYAATTTAPILSTTASVKRTPQRRLEGSAAEFFIRHAQFAYYAPDSASSDWQAFWLCLAARDGNPNAFSFFLQDWLHVQKIPILPGVFKQQVGRGPGRPRSPLAEVYAAELMQHPSAGPSAIAQKVLRDEYREDPKKAADRVRAAIRRGTATSQQADSHRTI
jgi:hypothetical protein